MIGDNCLCGRIMMRSESGSPMCGGCDMSVYGCTCRGGSAERAPETSIAEDQPQPHGQGVPVAERLIALIHERTAKGIATYGEPLTTHNGRDSTIDAIQESVDLNQYLMRIIMEQEDEIEPLADYLLSFGGPERDESACAMAVRLLKGFDAGKSANRDAVI